MKKKLLATLALALTLVLCLLPATALAATYYVEDGSYLKLKYIKLGYDLPKKALTPWHCQNLNIFFQVENVFTATKYSGLDPELPLGVYGARVDNAAYPRARSFSFGINMMF